MTKRNGTKTIEVPQRVFDSMIESYQKWEEFRDEFEDFAFSVDREFIKKMRKARNEHLKGQTRSLAELRREL